MRCLTKTRFLLMTIAGVWLAVYPTMATVTETSDDFDTDINTFPNWVSVGAVSTAIGYDGTSAGDYDDGDPTTKLDYTAGMLLTGDGMKDDGGLRFNSQDTIAGNESIGLTIAGTMQEGEAITFTGSVYNDNISYSPYNAQLWNLTDNTLLAQSGNISVSAFSSAAYVPVDFSIAYTAVASDEGDILQIRFLENTTSTARDIYIDNFTLTTFFLPPLPARATYPWGDQFWFSLYSTVGADSAYAVEHGATGIGPYYGGLAGQVAPLAEAHVLGANFSYKVILPSMADFSAASTNFVWPSDATLIAEATAVVDAVETNLNIVMWDLVPEELRHWKADEMNFIEVVSDAIRAADPQGRPVMMYEPNNRTMANLALTVPHQEVCAKGTYVTSVNSGEFRHNRIWARWSMEQELGAIAGANTNAVPWIMLHMAYDAFDGEEYLIEDWCRHDAYMGLIMGGKGISIWSGYRPRNGFENDFQAYFDGYLTVATDLNLGRNLAPVFLCGAEMTGVTHNVTAGPIELDLVYPAGTTNHYPPVTYTMREFLGQQYLFMVNSATQAVTLTFSGVPAAPRTDLFQGLEVPASGGSFSIALDPYEVAGFRFDGYEAWRAEYFPAGGDDGENDDPDGDDRTNRDEFSAGTDPNNGSDFFQTGLAFSNAWKTISFNTASNRFYNVDLSTNLIEGAWVPMLGNEMGTGGDLSATDTNDHPSTFYRIQVARP